MEHLTLEKVLDINQFRSAAISSDDDARLKVLREIQFLLKTQPSREHFGKIEEKRLVRSDLDSAAERCYTAMIDIVSGRITAQYEQGQSLNLEYALEGFILEEGEQAVITPFSSQWYAWGKAQHQFEHAAERTGIRGKFAATVAAITIVGMGALGLAAGDDPDVLNVLTASMLAGLTTGSGAYAAEKILGYPITKKITGLKEPEHPFRDQYNLILRTVEQLMGYHRRCVNPSSSLVNTILNSS